MISRLKILFAIIVFMILVYFIGEQFHLDLQRFGILPRDLHSLPYIFSAPFLHLNVEHLMNNLFGMLIFGSLCLLRSTRLFVQGSVYIIVITGLLVWIFARQSVHIGASGWVFGLWSLNIALAFYERSFISMIIALFVLFFYGGMIFGVLPIDVRISYESHFFGAIAGVLTAGVVKRYKLLL